MSAIVNRLTRRLLDPVDIAPLVWFRVAFGVIMMAEVARFFHYDWIHYYYVEPKYFFKYYGFGWVAPWPGHGMDLHFVILGILAAAIALGFYYRLAAALFFAGFTYVFLLDQSRYLNHFYLVILFSLALIFVPAHQAFSLDARWQAVRRSGTAPAWTLWLLRAQMGVVYLFGGIAKLNGDWLRGEPVRLWLADATEVPLMGGLLGEEWMVYLVSWGGLLFDLLIVPMLLWRRTWWLAVGLAVLFNFTNFLLFNIGIFPWLALAATILLFAPRWPRSFPRFGGEPIVAAPSPRQDWSRGHALTMFLLGAWLLAQILIPLRHWIYPGEVQWTDEGHRFAWRMKLRQKDAEIELFARDPSTGAIWELAPLNFVTERQLGAATSRPDMILQLCHWIAEEWRPDVPGGIEIYAHAWASLNGRESEYLLNSEANLAAEPRSLRPAKWITRLTTPLPRQGRRDSGHIAETDPKHLKPAVETTIR